MGTTQSVIARHPNQLIDVSVSNSWAVELAAATVGIVIVGTPTDEQTDLYILLTQDGTAGRVAKWPGTVTFSGSAPQPTSDAPVLVHLVTTDGANWQQAPTESAPGAGGSGNATEIQGVAVSATTPTDGQSLVFSEDDDEYVPSGTSVQSVKWVDLGLIDLAAATMDGPTTLYDMPEGTFLSQIRFTDDPDSVFPDSLPTAPSSSNIPFVQVVIGTVKSFGWYGFALINPGVILPSEDTLAIAGGGLGQAGYGPFAALDTGINDTAPLVLSAASVGPIQVGLRLLETTTNAPTGGAGAGVSVAPITAWAAATDYDSPASNTVATPGVLQKCAITANGTIWLNDGTTGTSGADSPDFAGNAGGSVADGDNIVWYDTTDAPPTVGQVHAVAEIVTLVTP